jgi:serine/threonine protein kinase
MGEVYRAKDTRLERAVAIKVLPAEFCANAQLKIRFEREAKTISGLAHPHICTLYDIGHENGIDYLVLELLEGESLADRLVRGPLPIEQVLRFGAQIAEALDKAHRSGIVHRDLKPGNVMLTKNGAKLLDFGLARSGGSLGMSDVTAALATEHKPLTQEGMIVGTFQYMSPEQLDGRPADTRSDIFALGAVLYEMATGRRAFDGKTRASVIAAILDRDPQPISALQPMTPPSFERLVQACLRKDADERWQSAHDIAAELRWMVEGGSSAGVAAPVLQRRKRHELAWIGATALLALSVLALAFLLLRRPPPTPRELRAPTPPPARTSFDFFLDGSGSLTISPDGKWITFPTLDDSGNQVLWLRAIDSLDPHPLTGAEGASYPFWSPDSHSLAFFVQGKLKRLEISGGPPTTLAEGIDPRGGAWSKDGTIIFAPHWRGPLVRVSADGGKPQPLTTLDPARSETTHRYPFFLPDGEHFLYLAGTHLAGVQSDLNAIYVGSLKTKERKMLLRARSNAIYTAGHLLFVRDEVLFAQPFDPDTLELRGEPRRLGDDVYYDRGFFRAAFAAADDGTLVYGTGSPPQPKLTWVDRSGKDIGPPGEPGMFRLFHLSRDGKKVALEIGDPADIWILDLERGVRQRLTSEPLNEDYATWSPDGRQLAYATDRDVQMVMYMRAADGRGADVLLVRLEGRDTAPTDWSRDGRFLLFDSSPQGLATTSDIWILPMTGSDRKARPFLQSAASESGGTFSPDGKWIAFLSDESGRQEVYVTAADGSSGRQQISNTGAFEYARWRADGKELFYLAHDGTLVAMSIKETANGIEASAAQPLFRVPRESPVEVTGDGQRMLIARSDTPSSAPITLVTGWTAKRE